MLIGVLIMARELGQFCWTVLIVWVLSRHYFRADIAYREITTVIIVETPAFDAETLKVRIVDEGLVPICMNSLDDRLI